MFMLCYTEANTGFKAITLPRMKDCEDAIS